MDRRQMAMQIGGRFLVQSILRRYPEARYIHRKRLTREQVERFRLAEQQINQWLHEELPSFMSKDAAELTDNEKYLIRDAFYESVNMPSVALAKWYKDPRVADGVTRNRAIVRHALLVAHRQIRDLIELRSHARRNGTGWTTRHYDVARRSIFVVQNLFHIRFIDYESWVILRNYGRDWGRPILGRRFMRKLPSLVELEAELALVRPRNPGTPQGLL